MSNDDELDIFFNQGQQKSKGIKTTSKTNLKGQSKPAITQSPKVLVEDAREQNNKIPLLSMKAFIFNFKKFYKEKTRIRNLLSEPAAKQRTISMRIYLKNYLHSYREVKSMLIQTRNEESNCMNHFQELAFKDIHGDPQTHIYIRDPTVDNLAKLCQEALDQIFMAKETAFFEKRALVKFLQPPLDTEEYKPLTYEKIKQQFNAIQFLSSNTIQTVGQFIQQFCGMIQKLEFNQKSQLSFSGAKVDIFCNYIIQETSFKLVDIAHFLFENKYRRNDVETIMKFVSKVKQLYNKIHGFDRNAHIDGDHPLSIELITMAFNILAQKDKVSTDLIGEIVHNIKCVLNEHIDPKTVDRVRKVMEYNLIGDYLHKFFKDLDHQIGHLLTNIQHISSLIMTGIDNIGLTNKQEQLEVLLAFMHRVQEGEIDPHLADILQKHGKVVSNLVSFFQGELEEAQIKAHSNMSRRKKDDELEMPQLKQVLYADDEELKSGAVVDNRQVVDPYKLENADTNIRRPKLFNFNNILLSRNPEVQEYYRKQSILEEPLNEIQRQGLAESVREPEYGERINHVNNNNFDELIMAQLKSDIEPQRVMSPQYYNLRVNEADRDLLYEQEFKKLKQVAPNSKTEMITHLQSQIETLRKEVEMQKKIKASK